MKNIVGQTPRGDDFYPRNAVIDRIYRRLDSGNHLYLSAPRRSGKTSIMRAMEDNPREGYIFTYLNVEDSTNSEDYFRLLAEELEKSAASGKLARLGEKAKGVFESFLERIKKVKLAGFEMEVDAKQAKPTYAEAFEGLLKDLDKEKATIVIMVDEFPVALENIAKTHGNAAAVQFLHANRGMRQRAGSGIRFMYTGSIGLPNVARKLDPAPTINDLNIVEIPPLSIDEGLDMSKRIFSSYVVEVPEEVLLYMLGEIQWLMPFFIQLVVQLLIDESENEQKPIDKALVDKVLLKAANHRNNVYFASYLDRLSKTLPADQCETAKAILSHIATHGLATRNVFQQDNAQSVLETLEYDGYIHEHEGNFRFNSPILRMWWKKNA
ncbi:MAG: ATP-binding protein [Saprospiraceae bacterium]|nr:ATP-binding protein [Saprospiraceae bacterium]